MNRNKLSYNNITKSKIAEFNKILVNKILITQSILLK